MQFKFAVACSSCAVQCCLCVHTIIVYVITYIVMCYYHSFESGRIQTSTFHRTPYMCGDSHWEASNDQIAMTDSTGDLNENDRDQQSLYWMD